MSDTTKTLIDLADEVVSLAKERDELLAWKESITKVHEQQVNSVPLQNRIYVAELSNGIRSWAMVPL